MPETTEKTFGSDFVPIARRQLPMFFMIDTSGSMDGAKIGTIDTTMRELLPELVGMGEADADIRIAILTFSSGCEWMTTAPQQPTTTATSLPRPAHRHACAPLRWPCWRMRF